GATNSSGFTGLPGGSRETNGEFGILGWEGNFWSSSQNSAAALACLSSVIGIFYNEKATGLSVRCIRD
ncbi:MAG: FISUMP domain-containing protein, partial [Bacteroidota bacterium]